MFTSSISTKILHFLYAIWVIRLVATEEYGKFVYIVATVSFFSFFLDSGLNAYAKREVAAEKSKTNSFLGELITTKSILFLILLPVLLLTLNYITTDPRVKLGFFILFGNAFIVSFISNFSVIFHAHEKFKIMSIQSVLTQSSLIVFGFVILSIYPNFISLLVAQVLSTLSTLFYIFYHARKMDLKPKFKINLMRSIDLIKRSFPFAAKDFFTLIYFKSDTFILGIMHGHIATGLYGAAYGLIRRLEVFPNTIFGLIYPRMATKKKEEDKVSIYGKAMKINMLLAFPIVSGGIIIADELIPFLLSSKYTNSVMVFKVLLLAFFFFFVNNPLGSLILNLGKEKKLAVVAAITAIANVVGNIIYIPKYGIVAAAITTVIAELLVFLQSSFLADAFRTFKILIKNSILPIISSAIMGVAIIYGATDLHVLIKLLVGIVVYTVTIIALEFIFNRELAFLIIDAIFMRKKSN
jgi:O-antigen/teichoic acid export membrane protein